MRDDTKEQLDIVNARIEKAKSSFDRMHDFEVSKTLAMESVGLLPLGQFPDEQQTAGEAAKDNDNKPH